MESGLPNPNKLTMHLLKGNPSKSPYVCCLFESPQKWNNGAHPNFPTSHSFRKLFHQANQPSKKKTHANNTPPSKHETHLPTYQLNPPQQNKVIRPKETSHDELVLEMLRPSAASFRTSRTRSPRKGCTVLAPPAPSKERYDTSSRSLRLVG